MHVFLWLLQALLSAAFLAHGLMLLFPPADVATQMNAMLPRWFSLFLGVAEVAAGLGLILPGLLRIQPWLVWLAALGLLPIMAGAIVLHIQRGETPAAVTTTVLFVMLAAVAYLRARVAPIAPRPAR
jgi:uncharacterized membrane protein YphA (DoxX/SURF4 family)